MPQPTYEIRVVDIGNVAMATRTVQLTAVV
jgi:hypothetical protein